MQKLGVGPLALLIVLVPFGALASDAGDDGGIDIIDPPDIMVQLAWRNPDGQVALQYTYTAPNGCWSAGAVNLGAITNGQALLTFVPEIGEGFCSQELTPIDYSGSYDIGPEAGTLRVIIEHPLSGTIEESELWINPEGKTDTQAEIDARAQ